MKASKKKSRFQEMPEVSESELDSEPEQDDEVQLDSQHGQYQVPEPLFQAPQQLAQKALATKTNQ